MPTKRPRKSERVSLLLGLGLDATDGEKRVTKGRDFLLVGGSTETHELMTERAVKVNEELDRRGKRLDDVRSRAELRDIVLRVWK
jgi:hypothetical protein